MWRNHIDEKEEDSEEERMLEQEILAAQLKEEELARMMQETGNGTMQINGQRIYGGPPPKWNGPPPPKGCEVFVGKIPRDIMEEELLELFLTVGTVYELRLMMDFSGCNRGFAFVQFAHPDEATEAMRLFNNFEMRPKHRIGVLKSIDNCRLFFGGIPKTKSLEEIQQEIEKITEGVRQVIVYSSITDKTKNRGFAFVEYENHRMASKARRKLIPDRVHLFGKEVAVDWAETEPLVAEDVMAQVTVLYVRNLSLTTTEHNLHNQFNSVSGGDVTKVKMMRDFAFIHFASRSSAENAMKTLNNTIFNGTRIEVVWAKPVKEKLKETKRKISLNNPKAPANNIPERSLSCSPTMPMSSSLIPSYHLQPPSRAFPFPPSPNQIPRLNLPPIQTFNTPPTTSFVNFPRAGYNLY